LSKRDLDHFYSVTKDFSLINALINVINTFNNANKCNLLNVLFIEES